MFHKRNTGYIKNVTDQAHSSAGTDNHSPRGGKNWVLITLEELKCIIPWFELLPFKPLFLISAKTSGYSHLSHKVVLSELIQIQRAQVQEILIT